MRRSLLSILVVLTLLTLCGCEDAQPLFPRGTRVRMIGAREVGVIDRDWVTPSGMTSVRYWTADGYRWYAIDQNELERVKEGEGHQ